MLEIKNDFVSEYWDGCLIRNTTCSSSEAGKGLENGKYEKTRKYNGKTMVSTIMVSERMVSTRQVQLQVGASLAVRLLRHEIEKWPRVICIGIIGHYQILFSSTKQD